MEKNNKIQLKMPIPHLSDQIFKNILWVSFRTLIIYGARIIALMIFARFLKPEDFGIITASMTMITFLSIVHHLGIEPFLVQYPKIDSIYIRVSFTLAMLIGGTLSLLSWVIAPIIAYYFHIENITVIIRILSPVFLLQGLSTVSKALLQREMCFKSLAKIEMLSYITGYIGVGIPLAVCGFRVWALVGAYLTETFVSSISALILRPHDFRPAIDRKPIRHMLKFAEGYILMRFANYMSTQADKIIVGQRLGAHELGIYSRAYYLIGLVSSIVDKTIGAVLFAAMARLQHNQKQLALIYLRTISLISLICCPIVIISMIIAPELVDVLLGKQWNEIITPLRLLTPGIWSIMLYEISHRLIMAKGNTYSLGRIQIFYAGLVVLGTWIGLRWGVDGVAIGVMLAMVVDTILVVVIVLKLIEIKWYVIFNDLIPIVVSSCILGLCGWIISFTLRFLNFHSIAVLLIVGLSCFLIWSLFWRLSPTFFFGSTATEATCMMLTKASSQMQAVLRFLLGNQVRVNDWNG